MAAVNRVFEILRLFADVRPVWTVEEVMEELGISISTAYRDIRVLTEEEFLSPVGGGQYVLGPAFIEFDRTIRKSDPLLIAATPIMKDLVNQVGMSATGLLCRAYRDMVMCVHQERSGGSDADGQISYERGLPMPMFRGATSRVILAYLPNRNLRRIYDTHTQDIKKAGMGTGWNEFKANLRQVRRDGYCVTTGAIDPQYYGIAAPIRQDGSEDSEVIGSLSLVLKQDENIARHVARLAPVVIGAAREIEVVMETEAEAGKGSAT